MFIISVLQISPRSGKPEELRAKYGIDSESIVKMVDQLTVGEMML